MGGRELLFFGLFVFFFPQQKPLLWDVSIWMSSPQNSQSHETASAGTSHKKM